MNWRTWAPLALAIVLGLVAMKIARDLIVRGRSAPPTGGDMNYFVVAKNDVAAGSALTAKDLRLAKIEGEINPLAVFSNTAAVEGRIVTSALLKGQPVLETLLAPVGTGSGLQALIPQGKRAISLEVNEFSGVAGYLAPGCRVDVVATLNNEGGEMLSRTIVQNVRVQAVGRANQDPSDSSTPVKSITLVVSPQEAEAIELAVSTSRPTLLLRGSADQTQHESDGVSIAALRRQAINRADPFAVQQTQLVRTVPATQPIETRDAGVPTYRIVKIIRAGVESDAAVPERPDSSPRWMTGAGTEELPAGGKR